MSRKTDCKFRARNDKICAEPCEPKNSVCWRHMRSKCWKCGGQAIAECQWQDRYEQCITIYCAEHPHMERHFLELGDTLLETPDEVPPEPIKEIALPKCVVCDLEFQRKTRYQKCCGSRCGQVWVRRGHDIQAEKERKLREAGLYRVPRSARDRREYKYGYRI